jgi:phosphopantothenoylcysteine decarboxylase/phosphopantothenate--cysteine ligase
LANAEKKLKAKNADLMVANDVSKPDAGFNTDTNIVTLLTPDGKKEALPRMSKRDVAHKILDKILNLSS